MTDKTLYLIQSSFANTESVLNKLTQIYAHQDAIVLMGDAVLFYEAAQLQNKDPIYVLENDAEILPTQPQKQIQRITYAEFSDLVLNFKRSISLK